MSRKEHALSSQDFRENVMKICILQNLVRKNSARLGKGGHEPLEQFSGNVKRLEKNMHFCHAGFQGKCHENLPFCRI